MQQARVISRYETSADKVNAEGVLDVIRQNIKENCPDVAFFIPEHHKWYQFGYGSWKHKENLADRIWKIVVYL